jgi:hypothetical protein
MTPLKQKHLGQVVKSYRSERLTDLVGEQTEEAFMRYCERLFGGWEVHRARKGSVADIYFKVDVLAVRYRNGDIIDCIPIQVKSSREAAEAVIPKLIAVEDYPCLVALRVFYPDESGRGFKEVRYD